MTNGLHCRCAGGEIPDSHCPILGSGSGLLAIWGEGHCPSHAPFGGFAAQGGGGRGRGGKKFFTTFFCGFHFCQGHAADNQYLFFAFFLNLALGIKHFCKKINKCKLIINTNK